MNRNKIFYLFFILFTFLIASCAQSSERSSDEVIFNNSGGNENVDNYCDNGDKKSCHLTIGRQNGVLTCFVGIQYCINNIWSDCTDGEEITKVPSDDGKPLSLTEEKTCENNPCDIFCSKWVEDGSWDADGSFCKWNWKWSADPKSSIDTANNNGAAKEPCTHGSQCHQNQKCQDPAQGSCSHDICTKGEGLIKGCETKCVDKICEEKPQCCEKKYEGTCETEPCLTYDKGLTKDCDSTVTKVCDWDKTCCPYTEWDVCSYWDIIDYQTVCEWVDTYVCGWNEIYTCGWHDIENYSCGWHWVNVYYCGWHWTWVQVYLCGWHWTYVYTYLCGWRWIEYYLCGWRWRYIYTYICGWRWRYIYTYICGWYYVYTYICGWRWRYIYTYFCGWRWKQVYLCGWRWRYVYTYFCGWRWRQTYVCGWRWTWIQNYVCGWTWICDWWGCYYGYDCWWEQQYVYTYECWWEQEYVYDCWWEDVYTYLYECWWEQQYVYECWWEDVYTYLYECWWENVYTYGCWWEDVYTYLYECWWEDVYTYLYECWWEQVYVYECWWENVYTYLYECWWDQQYVYTYECWWDQEYRYDCGWYWETVYECWWEQVYECWWELQENCWDDPIYGWIYYDCEKSYDGLWDQHCVDQYKEYDPGQCPMSWKGDWDATCINAVHDTCHNYCDGVKKGAGECVEWEAPNFDKKCDSFELGVGLTCKNNIPICNTGSKEAPSGIPIAIMPNGSGYFGTNSNSLPGAKYCYTNQAIPPGECINVSSCNVVNNDEIVVNPSTNASHNKDECFQEDNWGFFYDKVCDYPPNCPGNYSNTVKIETYETSCDSNMTPQWGFFTWEATTPEGTEISFRIRSANTKNDLSLSNWISISTKSNSNLQDCLLTGPSPCPIDLYKELGQLDAQKKFLELEVTFTVSNDKKKTPVLNIWEITYSCRESQ